MSTHQLPHGQLGWRAVSALAIVGLTACGGGSSAEPTADQAPASQNAVDSSTAPRATPTRQALVLETALAGGYGTLEIATGACTANIVTNSCSVLATVRLDQGKAGQISSSLSLLSSGPAAWPLSVTITAWQLEAGGWVAETTQRQYTLQADDRFVLSGGRYGSSGWTGQLITRDLAGTALADWPGVPAGTAGSFPAGALALRLVGTQAAPRWRLTDLGASAALDSSLASFVDRRLTPTDGQPPASLMLASADNPARLAYSFDAALATQGSLTVWRLVPGGAPQRLGSGVYTVTHVQGQELLGIDSLDAGVRAALDADSLARVQRGERHIAAWAGNRLRTGTLLPAGADSDTAPRLNRVAIDAVLMALGLGALAGPTSQVPGDHSYVGAPGAVGLPGDVVAGGSVTIGGGSGTITSPGAGGGGGGGGSIVIGDGGSLVLTGDSGSITITGN